MKLARYVVLAVVVFGLLSRSGLEKERTTILAQGQPGCTVTVQPSQSIQSAIDAAQEGAVICLAAGTFLEDFTIIVTKSLILQGMGLDPQDVQIVAVGWGYPVIRIESWANIEVTLKKLTITKAKLWDASGIKVLGNVKLSLEELQILDNWMYGLEVRDSAWVNLKHSIISNNSLSGLHVGNSAIVSLSNSNISSNGNGLFVSDSARVNLAESIIFNNGQHGLKVTSATAQIERSTIAMNGTHAGCKEADWLCTGITIVGDTHITIVESKIIANADWGMATYLKKCGYLGDIFDGTVAIDDKTIIAGNNMTSNHQGNPGHHYWNRPEVPDGQVCLP